MLCFSQSIGGFHFLLSIVYKYILWCERSPK